MTEVDYFQQLRRKWEDKTWCGNVLTRLSFSLRKGRVTRREETGGSQSSYINISLRSYSTEDPNKKSTPASPTLPLHTNRKWNSTSGDFVSPSPSLVNSLHGILRYLLYMLPVALRFRVFKESAAAAGLFSSFLHLMDFISRHFLTTTQWSSSASISQFSSVNCQVTVPRKLAIIFSLISRNIFKEWQVETDLHRRLKENTQTSCQQKCENIYEIFTFLSPLRQRTQTDLPAGLDIVKRDGRNCAPYYSTKGIFIILESPEWRLRWEKEDRRKGDLDNSSDCVVFGRMCRQFVTSHFFVQRTMNITAREILPPRRSSIFLHIHSGG